MSEYPQKPANQTRKTPTFFPAETMKRLIIPTFAILLVLAQALIVTIQASHGRRLLKNLQILEPAPYVAVIGCNNNCDIACCYCDIREQPPVCVQCCKEGP